MNTLKNLVARPHAGNIALSITALALVLLIATLVGPPMLPAADAGLVATTGDYTALTVDGGNDDVLVVLDGRSEQLFVYRVVNQTSVQIFQREDVARIFSDARSRARTNP